MARKSTKLQPAELSMSFTLPAGSNEVRYIDLGQAMSFTNRRLYEQGKCYYVERLELLNSRGGSVVVSALPDTWVTANAHTKGKSLWKAMNDKVLADNPSVKPKWFDFKCFFDQAHYNGGTGDPGPTLNLLPVSGGTPVTEGEWRMSQFVNPQHSVDTVTGDPLAADQYYCHVLQGDIAVGANIDSAGLISGYEDTRARVQDAPDVPGEMSLSWMTLLTDDGSQEPELANLIEYENDEPPYQRTQYPGGGANFNEGVVKSILATTSTLVVDKSIGFKVPLGLLKLTCNGDDPSALIVHMLPGMYKGTHATDVRQ